LELGQSVSAMVGYSGMIMACGVSLVWLNDSTGVFLLHFDFIDAILCTDDPMLFSCQSVIFPHLFEQ